MSPIASFTRALLPFAILVLSCSVSAERYLVTENAFGQTDASKVSVESDADVKAKTDMLTQGQLGLLKEGANGVNEMSTESSADLGRPESHDQLDQQVEAGIPSVKPVPVEEISRAREAITEDASSVELSPTPERKLSVFEQKYLEGIEEEKKAVIDLIRRNQGNNLISAN